MDVLTILDEAHMNEGATTAPPRKIIVKKTQKNLKRREATKKLRILNANN